MKLRRILLLLIILVGLGSAQAHAEMLVPTGATWRWRPGTNEASSPINLWREISFGDADFNPGPAPFGDGETFPIAVGTQVGACSSLFLRQTFVITNLPALGSGTLRLGAVANDGFVAWINGTEVK